MNLYLPSTGTDFGVRHGSQIIERMDNKDKQNIINEALGEFLHVMMWRRNLHLHPELSFQEHRTAKVIGEALSHEGISFSVVAGTGILAKIEGTMEGGRREAVVLRADTDALPITEAPGSEFVSVNKGIMHACGHDMHTAMLLGALKILNNHRHQFRGTVFGLFQPGEELNPGGASMVLEEHPFDGYNIVAFVGQHVEPMLKTGTFGFRKGKYMASSDELRFRVRGAGGHAALRERIKDPVRASAELIRMLYDIPSANPSPSLPTIVSIGKVTAEGATNVVPDEAYMEGTMRAFDEDWRGRIKVMIREAAAQVDEAFGVSTQVDISDGYPCVYNDEELTQLVEDATVTMFGEDSLVQLGLRPTAEDFGYYTHRYPSVYYRLGVGGDGEFFDRHSAGRIHTSTFRPDEKALGYGVVQFINIVFTLLG